MSMFTNWSLRAKIAVIGIALPALLAVIMLFMFRSHSRTQTVESYVGKARAICLTAESTRQEMEDKWTAGLFNAGQLRQWAEAGQGDKVLKAVPVVSAWQAAMRKAKEGDYEFRVPKVQPRNPDNQPDEVEARALKAMDERKLDEYFEIDKAKNVVRYFRPVKLSETCMLCHGDPATSKALWGNDQGLDGTGIRMENWKVGETHGAFEVVQSLAGADAELAATSRKAGLAILFGLLCCAVAFIVAITWAVNKPVNRITALLNEGADHVASAAAEVSSASQSLAEGANESAAAIEETSSSLEEMTSMSRHNAQNLSTASDLVNESRNLVETATHGAHTMDNSMREIKSASDQTSKIVKTIDEIAFQTNLLALNAAVEAARAGEAGKGFAVVAEEVRNLAMRSAEAAKNTSSLIEETIHRVASGVDIVNQLKTSLDDVMVASQKVSSLVQDIAAASNEQSKGVEQISIAIGQMNKVTQHNASTAEESAAASEELNGQAGHLRASVAHLSQLVTGGSA
jgi:methyl-accepting chemotaxis protein